MQAKKKRIGRWKRQRQKPPYYRENRGQPTTWRNRYARLQKFLAKNLKKAGFKDIRILDLGCGIAESKTRGKYSPTAEHFMRLLEINKAPVNSYVAVDTSAEKREHRGISYVNAHVGKFIKKKNISNPNVIVMNKLLPHLGLNFRENVFPEVKKFAALCWKKVPEKGILVTDVHLLGTTIKPAKSKWGIPGAIDRRQESPPIVVQKVNGNPKILFVGISESMAKTFKMSKEALLKTISENFTPSEFEIEIPD